MAAEANQDRFLGAILGMAIGDAVGMPLAGMTAGEIEHGFGAALAYRPRVFDDGIEIKAGEVTDETEIAHGKPVRWSGRPTPRPGSSGRRGSLY